MKNRVGIITVHDIYNYSSILQAFATQHALERLGHEAEIIDYAYPNALHDRRSTSEKLKSNVLRVGNEFLKDLLPGRPNTTYKARYKKFKDSHYRLSAQRYETAEALQNNPPDYDIYMAGSDQIWRPLFVKDDPSFFLRFAPKDKPKVSYASSFGCRSIPEAYRETYQQYLSDFDAIAVREQIGTDIVRNLINREVQVVLDPTLLLTHDEWKPYLAKPKIEEPYILCYGLAIGNKYMEELALHISKTTGYKVVRMNGKFHDYFNRSVHHVLDAGPAEWMGYFANASFVLGRSFHATAFAINFRVPFLSILKGNPDGDTRQKHILDLLGIPDRAITSGAPLPSPEQFMEEINFDHVHAKLSEQREISTNYLQSAMSVA